MKRCLKCSGTGKIPLILDPRGWTSNVTDTTVCPDCEGTGSQRDRCEKCGWLKRKYADGGNCGCNQMATRKCPKCKSENTSIQAFPSPAGKFYPDDPGSARADKCWNCGKVFT